MQSQTCNAIEEVWPSATVRGCYFHFKQALWRNFHRFDLTLEYQVIGSDIRKSVQRIGALPFVPEEDLDYAWDTLKPTIPNDMDDFVRYFESTWMGTAARRAQFPPSTWNQYDASLARLPRSSNMAEGWNNGFRSLVRCTNPTIWTFLETNLLLLIG